MNSNRFKADFQSGYRFALAYVSAFLIYWAANTLAA